MQDTYNLHIVPCMKMCVDNFLDVDIYFFTKDQENKSSKLDIQLAEHTSKD